MTRSRAGGGTKGRDPSLGAQRKTRPETPKEGKMKSVTVPETEASGVSYAVTFNVFESLAEAAEEMDGGEVALLENLNSKQRQSALQSPKSPVRDAISDATR